MTRERWDDFISTVKDSFEILNEGSEPLEDRPGRREFIEFQGPLGHVRLELITANVITGKRGMGGHKVGAGTGVKYEYSDTEQSTRFVAYKKVGDEWQEIDASMFEKNA